MIACPRCGSDIQNRKLYFLTNHNTVTCHVYNSKLQVQNTGVNSAIGATGDYGKPRFFAVTSWFMTRNTVYRELLMPLFVGAVLVPLLTQQMLKKSEMDKTE